MREKTVVCTGIILILMIFLGSWAFLRVEASAYGYTGPRDAVVSTRDESALPNFIYNPACISESPLLGQKQFSSGIAAPSDVPGAAQASAAVIQGKVLEVYYTFAGGLAWTQANVQVLDSVKGGLSSGDTVSVYFQGGYASAEDFSALYGEGGSGQEGFYRVVTDGVSLPVEGEEGILFLNAVPEGSSLPAGAYVLSCGKYSVMSPSAEGLVASASGSQYTYDQLCELIQQAEAYET